MGRKRKCTVEEKVAAVEDYLKGTRSGCIFCFIHDKPMTCRKYNKIRLKGKTL